jgi:hypothetical protein
MSYKFTGKRCISLIILPALELRRLAIAAVLCSSSAGLRQLARRRGHLPGGLPPIILPSILMSDQPTIIFSMAGVSKIYPPQKQVLKNIYLSFFYGAKIGVLGLNGSGKSSLLKIIAGVDKQFQGEVVFSPGYSVGYLEQEPQLDPAKTVREVVEEGNGGTSQRI